MDPVTLIVSALTAGATAALQETAGTAIKDTYQGLVGLVRKKFDKDSKAKAALAGYQEDRETWQKPLEKSIQELGIAQDKDVLALAQKLQELLHSSGSQNNVIKVEGNVEGIVNENKGTVVMNFNTPKKNQNKKNRKTRG